MQIVNRHSYSDFFHSLQELKAQEVKDAMRWMCLNDLYFLLRYGLERADLEHDWLFERCREVQACPDEFLDLWSREHYKSTILTYGKSIQDILNNPEITIGIFSHTRPIAKAFLRQIKNEFERNEQLKDWFSDILWQHPRKEAPKWSEDDGIVVKRANNPKEATVEAWGVVDGQPTSKHFSLLVYDDLVTRESVTTPEQIEKTTEALVLSYNLGAHGGKRRFIGTRYHFNDTYKTLMERGTVTPRIYAATDDGTMDGQPVFLSQQQLDNKRRDMGVYVFSCQMLQNPVADLTQGFKREWLKFYDKAPATTLNWYLLVDAANAKRKDSDYTSIWAVGLGTDKKRYCVPVCRDRLNVTERAHLLIKLHQLYQPIEVRYEEYGMQSDIAYIELVQNQENYRFDILKVAGSIPKPDRIKRLIPLFEDGHILLPTAHKAKDYQGQVRDLVTDFINEEYSVFPVPVHDDMLDALSRMEDTYGYRNNVRQDLRLRFPDIRKPKLRDRLLSWRVI